MAAVVSQRRYQRRQVLVVSDLADLRGPVAGTVELPVRLFWSGDDQAGRFSLDDPVSRGELYRVVLREARRPADLADFLDGDTLVRLWPELSWRLPPQVRGAWEDQHPALRASGRDRAAVLRTAS